MSRFHLLLPVLAAAALTACAPRTFEADVTRFHAAGVPQPQGQTVTVKAAREEIEGPEFSLYADMVGRQLGAIGFTPAGQQEPDLVALMDYSTTPAAVADGGGGGRVSIGGSSFGGNIGVGGGVSFPLQQREPEPAYRRRLELALVAADTGERLWEGRAVSLGQTDDLAAVMPLLAEALLQNYPGPAGTTVTVELPVETTDQQTQLIESPP